MSLAMEYESRTTVSFIHTFTVIYAYRNSCPVSDHDDIRT